MLSVRKLFEGKVLFFFSSRRRHTRWNCDWSSDVCSSDLDMGGKVEMKILIERALETLSEYLARILRKHYLEDKAYETIAEEDGTTIAAVKMKLYRAKKTINKLFDRAGGSTKVEADKAAIATNKELV